MLLNVNLKEVLQWLCMKCEFGSVAVAKAIREITILPLRTRIVNKIRVFYSSHDAAFPLHIHG
jgi:hypothetical protein